MLADGEPITTGPASRRGSPIFGGRARFAVWVVAAWALVALAWLPPTVIIQRGAEPLWITFVFVLLSFVPWMIATPFLFRFGSKYPISGRATAKHLALHAAMGVVALPVLTALGLSLNISLLRIASSVAAKSSWSELLGGVVISTFYAVPTYIAVTAVGQAFVNFRNFQNRERLLARAELRALRAQIEPHFLFNTLNAISAIGYGDPKRADGAITRLSDFLRLTLKDRPQEVALKDEIAFLRTYLDIHALLLGDKLQVKFEISDDAWDAAVPAMLLQPIAENAVVHGVGKRVAGGWVIFNAAIEGRSLVLTLSNDCADQPETVKPGQGLGLQNVKDRLRLLYGDEQAFDAGPHESKFVARIALPYKPIAEAGA